MQYYSQYGQDTIIEQFFKKKGIENGFFLDVGTLDGIRYSNTLLMEESGWKGICVEAHPSYFDLLKENRKNSICYSCAAGDRDDDEVKISLNFRGSLTTLDINLEDKFKKNYNNWYGDREKKEINNFLNGHHYVKMRKLDTLISENKIKNIDLISIDIDGSEKYAFNGITLEKYNCSLLVLEHTVMGNEYVNNFASKNGFIFAKTVGEDNFYVRTNDDVKLLIEMEVYGEPKIIKHPTEI
jgi:hypothetical protein